MMFFEPLFSLFLVLISAEALELGSRAITEDLYSPASPTAQYPEPK